jgi:hypothetical protein
MEHRYKAALRNLYKSKLTKTVSSEYRDHLFPIGWSYAEPNKASTELKTTELRKWPTAEVGTVEAVEEANSVPVTEKEQVIGSLNEFTKNLLEETESDSVIVGDIEISKKQTSSKFKDVSDVSKSELKTQLIERLGQNCVDYRYSSNLNLNRFDLDKLKVIFVSDTLKIEPHSDDNKDLYEFYALFDEQTAILFSKMVKAMKVDPSHYLLTAITFGEKEEDKANNLDLVLKEIATFKPDLVISLGVSASHALLESKQRLKDLHGNFYGLTVGDFSCEVMPLFSPSLLKSAPHMKSITWIDMQKAMEKLTP